MKLADLREYIFLLKSRKVLRVLKEEEKILNHDSYASGVDY